MYEPETMEFNLLLAVEIAAAGMTQGGAVKNVHGSHYGKIICTDLHSQPHRTYGPAMIVFHNEM